MIDFGKGVRTDAEAGTGSTTPASGLRGLVARSGLGVPATGIRRARWLYWLFDLGGLLSCLPAILLRSDLATVSLPLRAAGVVGLAVLVSVRVMELRRNHLMRAWVELPLVLALGVTLAAAGPLETGVMLVFTGSYFRAVYASTLRTLVATVGAVTALALASGAIGTHAQDIFVTVTLGVLASTALLHVLVKTLASHHKQVEHSQRLLSTVFDNLDVSVVVGPMDNAPALMNRAARTLYRELGLPAPPAAWSDAIEVCGADGETPLHPEQMPSALALSGQRAREVDVAMGFGEGGRRHFSVNAAPLNDPDSRVREVLTLREITAERQAADDLAHLATHDQLTGLANRIVLAQAIEKSLAALDGGGAAGAVLLLDLDGFKGINDTLGHAFGDEVLQVTAGRLRSSLRPGDVVARFGGDEFAILVEQGEGAAELAHRICTVVAAPMFLARSPVSISTSVGLVRLVPELDAAGAVVAADLAMYAAKTAGAGLVREYHPDMRVALDERLHLEEDLRRGLERDEFELFYQPIVNLETATVTGCEALVRWRHPTRGLVPPLSFIPIAEDNGVIVPLGRWILRTACTAAAEWQPADPAQVSTVAVNVSVRQLQDPGIVADVTDALRDSGLSPHALTLEITESALVDDSAAAIARLESLQELGVKIAIDDFGTGYSSLSRLGTCPADIIKIDASFVQSIETQTGKALVKAILSLAEALDLDVVAEGVETRGQARDLVDLGCRVAQGYYFAKPAPASGVAPPATQVSATRSPV